MNIKMDFEDKSLEEFKTECEKKEFVYGLIMKLKDEKYQDVWDILGYCGTMFLDWLKEARKYILDDTLEDNKTVRQIYIAGLKMIEKILVDNFLICG